MDAIFNNQFAFFKQLSIKDKVALISQLTNILNNELNTNDKISKQEKEDLLDELWFEGQSKEERLVNKIEYLMQHALVDLSTQEQQRYELLRHALKLGKISDIEQTELDIVTKKSERLDAQRMAALTELSELNNTSIEEVREQLKLRKKEAEHALIDELSQMWKDEDNLTAETIIDRTYSDREINLDD